MPRSSKADGGADVPAGCTCSTLHASTSACFITQMKTPPRSHCPCQRTEEVLPFLDRRLLGQARRPRAAPLLQGTHSPTLARAAPRRPHRLTGAPETTFCESKKIGPIRLSLFSKQPVERTCAAADRMHSVIEPNAWIALKLPSENVRVVQVVPNT